METQESALIQSEAAGFSPEAPVIPPDDHLLPARLRGAWAVGLAWVLPMAVLGLLNAQGVWLAWSEITDGERGFAAGWLWAAAVNLAAGVSLTVWAARRGRPLGTWHGLAPLLAQGAYLLGVTTTVHRWIPVEMWEWMLPPDRVLFQQWTFAMPAAFYGALVLAGFGRWREPGRNTATILGTMVGVPLIFFSAAHLVVWRSEVMGTVFLIGGTGATMLLGVALLRGLLLLWEGAIRNHRWRESAVTVVFALAMPLGGLALNRWVPFPVDFQHPAVYALVVVNAAMLLAPLGSNRQWNLSVWVGRCLTFPFTLYFFLVFLPFMPLAIPAMIAAGAGFLILTPTVLGVLHAQKLARAFQAAGRHRAVVAASGALALAVMPGYFLAEAQVMKGQLHRGMDQVLNPDYAARGPFAGSPEMVLLSLDWLEDFMSGVYYPLLSPLRSQVLFHGLTLPQQKIDRMREAFAGESPGRADRPERGFQFFGMARGSNRSLRLAPAAPPLPAASLKAVEANPVLRADGTPATRLRVTMTGAAGEGVGQSEFKTEIRLPPGAWVGGFALYLGEERLEGRLFEEKTALWVYRMIRDVDRQPRLQDPATLTCEDDGTLRLQVFPFDPGQDRYAEIDVVSLGGGGVRVGEMPVQLPAEGLGRGSRWWEADGGVSLWLDEATVAGLPAEEREPYFHVFVDRSRTGLGAEEVARNLAGLQAAHPRVQRVQVTLVHFSEADVTAGPVSWAEAQAALEQTDWDRVFPRRGGYLVGAAVGRAAYAAAYRLSPEASGLHPVWVAMTGTPVAAAEAGVARTFGDLLPDVPARLWRVEELAQEGWDLVPVARVRVGETVRVVDATRGGALLHGTRHQGNSRAAHPWSVWDPGVEVWQARPAGEGEGEAAWLEATLPVLRQAELARTNPAWKAANLADLVGASQRRHLLTPATAFIVVENDAQWKLLALQEQQKLAAHDALTFDETPEPALWPLALLLAAWLGWRGRRRGGAARGGPGLGRRTFKLLV